MGTDVNEGINGHPVAEFGIGMNEGQRADSGKAALRCGEQLQNAAEVLVGIFADQGASDIPGVFGTDYDGASPRCRELVSVFGVCQKAHFIGPAPSKVLTPMTSASSPLQDQAKLGRDFGEFTGNHLLLTGIGFRELAAAGLPQTVTQQGRAVMSRVGVAYITLPAAASRIRSSFCCLAIVVAAS